MENEELMKVTKSMEQRISDLEKAWNNTDEMELIKKLTEALDASLKYCQRLEERMRIIEIEFKKHRTETRVHGFR